MVGGLSNRLERKGNGGGGYREVRGEEGSEGRGAGGVEREA